MIKKYTLIPLKLIMFPNKQLKTLNQFKKECKNYNKKEFTKLNKWNSNSSKYRLLKI